LCPPMTMERLTTGDFIGPPCAAPAFHTLILPH
jgi:hypothetical protein